MRVDLCRMREKSRVVWLGAPSVDLSADDIEIVYAAKLEQALAAPNVAAIVVVSANAHDVVRQLCLFAESVPDSARLVYGTYEEINAYVREGGSFIIDGMLSSQASPDALRDVLRRHVRRARALAEAVSEPKVAVIRTLEVLSRMTGAIIRPHVSGADRVEIVIPTSAFAEMHPLLPSYWGWPLKARGEPDGGAQLPMAIAGFSPLSRQQEAYAMRDSAGRTWFFLMLPWRDGARATLVLGLSSTQEDASVADEIAALHAFCVSRTAEFLLPKPPATADLVWYASDYDWVVTPDYVGPDRRERDTSLVNRYALFGRRKRIAKVANASRPSQAEIFVDRLTPAVARMASIYIALSLVDTALTFRLVLGGRVRELNPLLALLLSTHPIVFLLVKNLLSLGALFVVVRFQLRRIGRVALWIIALVYAAVDLYWLWLLTGPAG